MTPKEEKELRWLNRRLDDALKDLKTLKQGNLRLIVNSLHYREYAHVCYLQNRIDELTARVRRRTNYA